MFCLENMFSYLGVMIVMIDCTQPHLVPVVHAILTGMPDFEIAVRASVVMIRYCLKYSCSAFDPFHTDSGAVRTCRASILMLNAK